MPLREFFLPTLVLATVMGWCGRGHAHPDHQLDLVAAKPAVTLAEDAFPVGNGFMGALIMGGIASDSLVLSDHALWEDLEPESPPSSQDLAQWRPQQPVATLRMETGHVAERARTFMRRLDLQTGTVEVTYRHDRVRHDREYFCAYPDRVLAARFRANRQGEVNLVFSIDSPHALEAEFDETTRRLIWRGSLEGNGLAFSLGLELRCKGGAVLHEAGRLRVQAADEVTLFLATASSFRTDEKSEEGGVAALLDALKAKDILTVRQAHLPDYQALFHSMYLTIEGPTQTNWTTERRLEAYRSQPSHDPGLEELLFQYTRYLMIASSREGSLPAHRRGRWVFPSKNGVDTAYAADWRLAYAGVRPTQLGDCGRPTEVWGRKGVEEPPAAGDGSTAYHRMRIAASRRDGNGAHEALRQVLQEESLPNLLRRDHDIGAQLMLIEALSLMLARVDGEVLTLLPALPEAWPDGNVVGLRPGDEAAPPCYEVAAAWQEGALLEAYLTHLQGGTARLDLDPREYEIRRNAEPVPLAPAGEGVAFPMKRDEMVVIRRRAEGE